MYLQIVLLVIYRFSNFAFPGYIYFRPNLFSWEKVTRLSPLQRLDHAFSIAKKHLGTEKLLDPEGNKVTEVFCNLIAMLVSCSAPSYLYVPVFLHAQQPLAFQLYSSTCGLSTAGEKCVS